MTVSSDTPQQLPDEVTCDVLLVGYGPVGMTCAALLAHYGLNVVVVERFPSLYGLPRAGHLDGETMRVYQRLGIAEQLELVGQSLPEAQFVSADGEVLGNVQTGESGSGWKADYMVYQPDLEDIISARAVQLGVEVFMGVSAEAIEQDTDGVRTTVRPSADQDAKPVTVHSAYVIGADGANSFVRSTLGIERLDLGFEAMPQLVVDFEFYDQDKEFPKLNKLTWLGDPDRPQLSGRYAGERISRVEISAKPGESAEQLENEEAVWKFIAPWDMTPGTGKLIRSAVYEFESTLAAQWRDGRVFLVGDAAHTMPPVLGQGMLAGVRDAENLAWKLAAVLAGEADERILDTYQSERAPHVKAIIEMAMEVGSMVLAVDPEQARRRDEMLRSSGGVSQPPFPHLGAGIVRPPEPHGVHGRPGLQARVATSTRAGLLDDFLGSGRQWRLISRHAVPDDLFTPRQKRFLESLNISYAHIHRGRTDDAAYFYDIDAEYHTWYLRTGRRAYIERPDRYVFGAVATIEELPALVDELAASLTAHGWLAGVTSKEQAR